MITVGGVPIAGEPVSRSALLVGPFTLPVLAVGSELAPADSDPEAAGYGGVSTSGSPGDIASWVAMAPGSITGLSVYLTGDAEGSAVRVRVLVGDTIYDDLIATVAAESNLARASCAAGLIPVAAGDAVALAVQTGSGWAAATVALAASLEVTPS
ncbi:MAG: hypothetical protein Q8S73_26665 [Deltaproteobacteria bacterium]|nr:hypothetical protein [Myxococcales bacterium]MDP3217719.1 hypothetical protein [Deltaproteobacteria bacterium]